MSNRQDYIDSKKETIPKALKTNNLTVNLDKTEQYTVKRHGNENWKNCKYLGTMLDTETDLKRRKTLANLAFSKYKHLLTSNKLPIRTRLRLLNVYVKPVLLYNSELWTLTQTLTNDIDVFQRKCLRRTLKIHWPYKITNEELYRRTLERPWSKDIKQNRLRLTGHILRLPEETPISRALTEAQKPTKPPRGRQKKTWIKQINSDLLDVGLGDIHSRDTFLVAQNRRTWRTVTKLVL